MRKSIAWKLFVFAAFLFLASGIFLYKGYDKMSNYRSPQYYSSNSVNAYVGGDGYNYIINGNYATGFFVLAMGFFIAGTVCVIGGNIINCLPADTTTVEKEEPKSIAEELPDL